MKALVVYNPFSGHQKLNKKIDFIKNGLKKKYEVIDVFSSTCEKSITSHLASCANNYDLIIVSGGDGTLNEAVTGMVMASSKTKLAYIPGGTVNDVGNLLKLSKNVKKGLWNALHGRDVYLDVCKINDRYSIYAIGAGKYTDVSYKARRGVKRAFGKMAYFMEAALQFGAKRQMDLEITADGNEISGKYYVILGLNSQRIAGFRLYRRKPVYLDDGKIDLTLIEKNIGGLTWPRLALFFIFGDHHKKGIKTLSVSNVNIKSNEDIDFNTDGELAFSSKEATITVLPKAIHMIVSPKIKHKYFLTRQNKKKNS